MQFTLGTHKNCWKDLLPNSARHFSFLLNDFSNQQRSNETIARPKSIASGEGSTGSRNGERDEPSDVDKLIASYWWSATISHQRHSERWITAPPRAMGGVVKQPDPRRVLLTLFRGENIHWNTEEISTKTGNQKLETKLTRQTWSHPSSTRWGKKQLVLNCEHPFHHGKTQNSIEGKAILKCMI
jgi:hypothetical protein